MPPKAARGIAGRGRPRGRGGGRSTSGDLGMQPEAEAESSQDTLSFPAINAPAKTTPPRRNDNDNDEARHSPNTSPASMPTETPAATPVRAPPTLDSDSASQSARGGALVPKGRGNAATSRFRPRNVRRDQSERDKLAEQERARIAEIQKVADAKAKKAAAERARKQQFDRGSHHKRGHGDMMGRSHRDREPERLLASGPFSAAAPSEPQSRPSAPGLGGRGGGGGGRSDGGGGGGGGKGRARGDQGGPSAGRVKSEVTASDMLGQIPFFEDDEDFSEPEHVKEEGDPGPMKNIDYIDLVSSDEDVDSIVSSQQKGKSKAKSNKGGLKPIRALRQAHKPPARAAYTMGSIKKESEEAIVEEVRRDEVNDVEMGGADDPNVEMDEPAVPAPGSPSRENSGKSTKPREPLRQPTKKNEKKPVLHTPYDVAEHERQMHHMRVLKHELAEFQIQTQDVEGDVDMSGPAEKKLVDKKEGRLYLFQFPPVLPELYNPLTQKPMGKVEDKETSGANDEDNDMEMTGETVDLTKAKDEGEEKIKLEAGTETGAPLRESFVTEEGFIGKLVVRQSGRAELDWGGTHMLLNTGSADNFTSSVVLAEEGEGGKDGTAMGMGKVFGRFVVTPDWESLF